ncbi:MAG: Trk system potassium transporter TrkA [Halolamina sp.]
MDVIIVGAGQVGQSIAGDLADVHQVTVIDVDAERVEELNYELDVLGIDGDGTSVETLERAGVADADMVVASTDDDETNVVVCSTVKAVSDAFTIARTKQTEYLRTWRRSRSAFGVDFMVCTNLLAAQTIVRIVGLPGARDVDAFAGGMVQMAEFEVGADSPVADRTVAEADTYDSLTFAAVVRDDGVDIPRGRTEIGADDRVVTIGNPHSIQQFAQAVSPEQSIGEAEEVVVVGGSEIGAHVARLLCERGISVRVIERDRGRARELAEELPEAVVMQSDATDVDFLEREHVSEADVVVAALDSDEKNLLVSLLADRIGVERTVTVVDAPAYVDLFEAVGVDVGVNPREVVAEEITRYTREGGAENVALVGSGRAEVVEVELATDSLLVDRPIRDTVPELPAGVVVGAITRDGEFIAPRGETVPETGDHVVLFVAAAVADEVTSRV